MNETQFIEIRDLSNIIRNVGIDLTGEKLVRLFIHEACTVPHNIWREVNIPYYVLRPPINCST